MKYLDLSFESPEKNLACDEVLHHTLENEGGEEVLRFWESKSPFVVLGYGNRHRSETPWKATFSPKRVLKTSSRRFMIKQLVSFKFREGPLERIFKMSE